MVVIMMTMTMMVMMTPFFCPQVFVLPSSVSLKTGALCEVIYLTISIYCLCHLRWTYGQRLSWVRTPDSCCIAMYQFHHHCDVLQCINFIIIAMYSQLRCIAMYQFQCILSNNHFSAPLLPGARLAETDAEKSNPTRPQGAPVSISKKLKIFKK